MGFIKKIDGFDFNCQRISKKTGKPIEVLILDKKTKLKSGLKYAIEKGVDNILIDLDLSQKDLDYLKDIPLKFLELKGLSKKSDLTFLNELKNLEYLSIQSSAKGNLDLSFLPKLETLNFTAGANLSNIDKASSLKVFHLWDFKDDSLPNFGNIELEEVYIYNSAIETLNALKNCQKIKNVTIEKASKLISIEGLESSSDSIEEFALRNCKTFTNYPLLGEFVNLRKLYLLNCGNMNNASPFSSLLKLNYGNIDVNIEDGNVDALMEMPIIFKNYKHFNQKNNLKIKVITNDGNYLVRGKDILYKMG